MRLPTLVVASFSSSCQADIVDIKKFLARNASEDLIAGTRQEDRLARLKTDLVGPMVLHGHGMAKSQPIGRERRHGDPSGARDSCGGHKGGSRWRVTNLGAGPRGEV